MTYQQAYDKIIQAYFRDEIEPLERKFCFCGTLCDNSSKWFGEPFSHHYDSHGYKGSDFVRMETALLDNLQSCKGTPRYEETLFNGMCSALEVLKQIHMERGEVIDETPVFTKRQLATM